MGLENLPVVSDVLLNKLAMPVPGSFPYFIQDIHIPFIGGGILQNKVLSSFTGLFSHGHFVGFEGNGPLASASKDTKKWKRG